MKNKWLFVVSTSNSVGRGHLNRSIVLASEISKKIDVDFYSNDNEKYPKEIKKNNKKIKFYYKGLDKLNLNNYLGVVIDIKKKDKKLIKKLSQIKNSAIINDHNNRIHHIKTIISPALEKKNRIPLLKYQKALIGKKFYLIPKRYKNLKNRIKEKVDIILINFGYLDSKHFTLKVLELLNMSNYKQNVIVLIGKNQDLKKKILRKNYSFKMKIYSGLNDLVNIYKKVDLSIGAGGVGMLERFLYGIPSITIMNSKDQHYAVLNAKRKQATVVLRYSREKIFQNIFQKTLGSLLSNVKKRKILSKNAYRYLDTHGSCRVANYLLNKLNK